MKARVRRSKDEKAFAESLPGYVVEPPGELDRDEVRRFIIQPTYDEDGVQSAAGIGLDGKEYGDPLPMAPPVGYQQPPDLMQMIKSMIQSERFAQEVDAQGFDTPEEADDFDIEDDPSDPLTPYEKHFEPPPAKPAASAVSSSVASDVRESKTSSDTDKSDKVEPVSRPQEVSHSSEYQPGSPDSSLHHKPKSDGKE